MRNLDKIITGIFTAMMVFIIIAIQILYCMNSTLLSPRHISELLEEDKNISYFTAVLLNSLDVPKEQSTQALPLKKYAIKILANTDQNWLKSQYYITLKGIHEYVFSDVDILPTLYFTPLKTSLKQVVVAEVMSQPDAQGRINNVKTVLTALNNKYLSAIIDFGINKQIVNMLVDLAPVRSTGFDKSSLTEIVEIYHSMKNKDINIDEASILITEQMTADALRLDQVKDYFDLNLFMVKAFNDNNPLKFIKEFVHDFMSIFSRTISVLFWCILIMILIYKRMNLKKVLQAMSTSIFISSIFCILASALFINSRTIELFIEKLYSKEGTLEFLLIKYGAFLARDFGLHLALWSFLTASAAAVLLLILKKIKMKSDKKQKSIRWFPVIRILLAVILFVIIFITWNTNLLMKETVYFRENLSKLTGSNITQSVINGLMEAGEMDFLKSITKK